MTIGTYENYRKGPRSPIRTQSHMEWPARVTDYTGASTPGLVGQPDSGGRCGNLCPDQMRPIPSY